MTIRGTMAIDALPRLVPDRRRLAFRSVNRPGRPGYDPGMQRHHLLPCQILKKRCFHPLLDCLGESRFSFDDFRSNGLLLPADDGAAIRFGLPLHRGPHRAYNAMVIERVGQIEAGWSARRMRVPDSALIEALERLHWLQRALRRRLLSERRPFRLNRRDPVGRGFDFSELDAMADQLWPATQPPVQD